MTMIKRVANALLLVSRELGEQKGYQLNPVGRTDLLFFEAQARAAIEAMREPTEQMIDACDINIPTRGEIIGIWSDMIDAALGKVDA